MKKIGWDEALNADELLQQILYFLVFRRCSSMDASPMSCRVDTLLLVYFVALLYLSYDTVPFIS